MRPQSILIIRLSAIGDVVMTTPVISAIRNKWPDARLDWLTQEQAHDVIRCDPRLDNALVLPLKNWEGLLKQKKLFTLLKQTGTFISALRSRRYDMVFDLQGLLKSAVLSRLTGAKIRVGLLPKEGSSFLHTRTVNDQGVSERISSEYESFCLNMGLETGDFLISLFACPEAVNSAKEKLSVALLGSMPSDERYIALAPFTTRPQKHWVTARWAELATKLFDKYRLPLLVLGAASDALEAQSIASGTNAPMAVLTGKTSIAEAQALTSRAYAFVGVDTGLTHMATGFGVPTVALFGSTRPYTVTRVENSRVISSTLSCSPCGRRPTCQGDWPCMKQITVKRTLNTLEEVLSVSGAP